MLYSASIQAAEMHPRQRGPGERDIAEPCCDVWISAVTLSGFRNYEHLSLTLDDAPVVLTGANGSGKTNLLEALSLMAPGRGLRRAKTHRLMRQMPHLTPDSGPDSIPDSGTDSIPDSPPHLRPDSPPHGGGWSVSVRVETPDGPFQAGTGIAGIEGGIGGGVMGIGGEDAPPRRLVRIDGTDAPQMALAERFAISWLTPEMDGILAAAPSERRRLLDRLVIAFDPAHTGRLQRYEKAARQRNRLADEGGGDDHWFEALESEMAASGVAIIAARKALVAALDQEAAAPLRAFPSARLTLEGAAEDWLETMPAVDVEDRLRDEMRRIRQEGAWGHPLPGASPGTLPGAGASLLRVFHSSTGQEAVLSSTGEQKALLISVILAHARLQARRLGKPPILLLDDVAAHLDRHRREALFECTAEMQGQVWFSGTDSSVFAPILGKAQVIALASGRLANTTPANTPPANTPPANTPPANAPPATITEEAALERERAS